MDYSNWVGRTESVEDVVTAWPRAALAATLDRDDPPPRAGDPLPPLWHWIYFLPVDRQSALGGDGHGKRGEFLPPVELPRRMWAGGRFEFRDPLRIGDAARRVSEIVAVQEKEGRSGRLVFVTVRHRVEGPRGVALVEEHDIVYREHGSGSGARVSVEDEATWRWTVVPDDVFLFRYSALTFNAHRIHYDRRYATQMEGYPGLVVHGPLIATLLLDSVRRNLPEARVRRFEFRAVAPLFDTGPFDVCGREEDKVAKLWAVNAEGDLAMSASAVLDR